MRKSIINLAAVAFLGLAAVAAPSTAEARSGWFWPGVIGGFAAGAIIGGALATPYYYPPPARYYGGPVYYAAPPRPRSCVRPVWDGYRWVHARVC